MSSARYKSDAVYKDVVLRYFTFSFVATLPIMFPSGIVLLAHGELFGDRLMWAVLILPATHLASWIILGTTMCLIFQAMTQAADVAKSPPPHHNPDFEIHWQPTGAGDYTAKVVRVGGVKNGK